MTRQRLNHIPKLSLHRATGQGVVRLEGRDHYCGAFGSQQANEKYERLITDWLARRRPENKGGPAPSTPVNAITINDLIWGYWSRHVTTYYIKNGKPTSEQDTIRQALRFLRKVHGHTPAREFGPAGLKTVRESMLNHVVQRPQKASEHESEKEHAVDAPSQRGLCRRFINKQISRIKRMFAWGVEEGMVPVEVHAALLRVPGLRRGRGQGREKDPVRPVSEVHIETVLPLVPPLIADMIKLQLLCGGRPQDIVQFRREDLDCSGEVWEYRPQSYKTEHHHEAGSVYQERTLYFGPRAQAILGPHLNEVRQGYLFTPARSKRLIEAIREHRRRSSKRAANSRVDCQRKGKKGRQAPDKPYSVASYRRAIRRACERAGIPVWFPLQLRHTAGTKIRREFGLEVAQAVLGHKELGVTQVYAEIDRGKARMAAQKMG